MNQAGTLSGCSPEHAIVFIMRTNPHPYEVIPVLDGKGSVS
jgi:hypothetical protein